MNFSEKRCGECCNRIIGEVRLKFPEFEIAGFARLMIQDDKIPKISFLRQSMKDLPEAGIYEIALIFLGYRHKYICEGTSMNPTL